MATYNIPLWAVYVAQHTPEKRLQHRRVEMGEKFPLPFTSALQCNRQHKVCSIVRMSTCQTTLHVESGPLTFFIEKLSIPTEEVRHIGQWQWPLALHSHDPKWSSLHSHQVPVALEIGSAGESALFRHLRTVGADIRSL